MITAIIYILIGLAVYIMVDFVIYFIFGHGPKPILESVQRAYTATEPEEAAEIAAAVIERLREWAENERKMEYKSVWTASRLANSLTMLRKRWEERWPTEFVEEIDKLADHLRGLVPKYFQTLFRAIVIALVLALGIRTFVIQAFKIPSGSMLPTLLIGDQLLVTKFTYGVKLPFSKKRLLDFRKPRRGDIVVFKPPKTVMSSWIDREIPIPFTERTLELGKYQVDFIKRIVGLPGDKVEIRDGVVYVNDRAMPLDSGKEYEYERANSSFVRNVHSWLFIEHMDGRPHKVLHDSNDLENEDWGPYFVGDGEFFAVGDNRDDSADSRTWTSDPARIEDIRGKALIIHFSWDQIKGRPRFKRMGSLIK